MIFYVFAFTFLANITADLILIHFYNAEGAAAAYLLTIIVQSILYLYKTKLDGLEKNCLSVLLCPAAAIAAGVSASFIFQNSLAQLSAALLLFLVLLVLTRQLRFTDWSVIKRVTGL